MGEKETEFEGRNTGMGYAPLFRPPQSPQETS